MGGEGLLSGKAGAARHRAAALLQCSNLRNPGHPRRTSGHTRRNPGHTRWRQQPLRAAALPDRKRRASGRRPENVHYFGGWFGKATEIVYLCMAGRSGDASPFFVPAGGDGESRLRKAAKRHGNSGSQHCRRRQTATQEAANGKPKGHGRQAKRPQTGKGDITPAIPASGHHLLRCRDFLRFSGQQHFFREPPLPGKCQRSPCEGGLAYTAL